MVHILYLNTGSIIGGAENQLLGLLKNLDRNIYNPIIICPSAGNFSDKLKTSGFPVYISYMPEWRKARSYPFRHSAAVRLAKMVSKYHIDLVHASNLWLNYYALHVGKLLGIPIISHVRNRIKPENVHKYLFDGFDRIIAISKRTKEYLVLGGVPSEKIEIIHDGVDLLEFNPNGKKGNALRQDHILRRYLIGLVGRIEPFKRQKDFIQIITEVLKVRQDVSFLIIGEAENMDYFRMVQRAIEENSIAEYVVFTGYRHDMPEVLKSLDILVSLSGGSVMYEAMACGKPVIMASDTKPVDLSIIQDDKTGIIAIHDDTYSISKAILELLEDINMQKKIGESGRECAENLFNVHKTTRLTEFVYEDILSNLCLNV